MKKLTDFEKRIISTSIKFPEKSAARQDFEDFVGAIFLVILIGCLFGLFLA